MDSAGRSWSGFVQAGSILSGARSARAGCGVGERVRGEEEGEEEGERGGRRRRRT